MKLNTSLKNYMALKLNKQIVKIQERGNQVSKKKADYFLFWLDQVKQASNLPHQSKNATDVYLTEEFSELTKPTPVVAPAIEPEVMIQTGIQFRKSNQ